MMNSIFNANWIISNETKETTVCPVFKKTFSLSKKVCKATLNITSLGLYKAVLNGTRVGDFIMAPGFTSYNKRLQYQEYDVTKLLENESSLLVYLGEGWCVGRLAWSDHNHNWNDKISLLASLDIIYDDDTTETIYSDASWEVTKSNILLSEIYDGETVDSTLTPTEWSNALLYEHDKTALIPQEGEIVREIERLKPVALIKTPKGETVIDFGQNLTGYVEFSVTGKKGAVCELSHAEVLDKEGNFYTANMRTAKNKITYICNGEKAIYKPSFTFQGFRYLRIDQFAEDINLDNFTAIVVHSDMKRTGNFTCSNPLVNKLFKNIIWGQRGNFLDIPTDCPQRDERLGWTGDAQVFVRAASYNYDVEKFFKKWLADLEADQKENGSVPHVIPNVLGDASGSAAWGDASVICPWQVYLTYGNKEILEKQFNSMKKWIEYIKSTGDNPYLWNTGEHYGDWLGLDGSGEDGDCNGATDKFLIATAYFAYSTSLLIKAGRVLNYDMSEYETLYDKIVDEFNKEYVSGDSLTCDTQTAYVLALHFNLVKNKPPFAKRLVELIEKASNKLTTGFVGTPYLLHALADNSYLKLAYSLLCEEEYPSWLFSVKSGATTMWEHWDGMRPDGSMWSVSMNSFNHYAYGAVADFIYGVVCGINTVEENPGFKHILLEPKVCNSFSFAEATIETRYGTLASKWEIIGDFVRYTFEVPVGTTATIVLPNDSHEVGAGKHIYEVISAF